MSCTFVGDVLHYALQVLTLSIVLGLALRLSGREHG